jgi:hypothetical protein
MTIPPFLLGAALLFWGWRVDLFLWGAIGAVLLEARQVFAGRWDFTNKEFNRLWDLCTALFLSAAIYLRFSEDVVNSAYKFFQWFPLIFLPMAIGQLYSNTAAIPYTTFSWYMRGKKQPEAAGPGVNFGWIYVALCLITSGASNLRDRWFYLGVICLAGAAIWRARPKRFAIWTFGASFILAATLGFFGHVLLQETQQMLEGRASEFFTKWARKEFDALESRTSMGRIGELKQSSRVVMKVRVVRGQTPPLLRQASYSRYNETAWQAHTDKKEFTELPLADDLSSWRLAERTNVENLVRISARIRRKEGLISLPVGAALVQDLPALAVATNGFGATMAKDAPALAGYLVSFGDGAMRDAPPDRSDRFVPDKEYDVISDAAATLGVYGKPVEEKLAAVERFFESQFTYSTYQEVKKAGWRRSTALEIFLTKTRRGHCEFFATATTLLLRELGIPARYATGYAVQDSDGGDNKTFTVREKHAHAWTLAWVRGKWIDIDNTPAGWSKDEDKDRGVWDGIKDRWESFTFGFMEWKWLGQKGWFARGAPWLLGAMSVFLAWRIFGRKWVKTAGSGAQLAWPGADSDYYLVESYLQKKGLTREQGETPLRWIARLKQGGGLDARLLPALVRLHYRYRFDPSGLSAEGREELRACAKACLESEERFEAGRAK